MISLTNERPTFLIDSDNRNTGTNSMFTINVPIRQNNKFDTVALVSIGVPKSYYNVDTGLNTFTLKENGASTIVTLSSGSYNITNYQRLMESQLNTASSVIDAVNPWTYTLSFDDSTFKWTYTISAPVARAYVSANIILTGHESHEVLGFANDSDNVFDAFGILESTYANNFERTKYITVKSDIARNSGNAGTDSSIVAHIPVNTTSFDQIIRYDLVDLGDGSRELANNASNCSSCNGL